MIGTPIRVQRRRSKGWRLPQNTVCVDRSTRWGNPFIVGKHGATERCVDLFEKLLSGYLCLTLGSVVEQKKSYEFINKNIEYLQGKNLACWCHPSKPCHADVLLRLANEWRG